MFIGVFEHWILFLSAVAVGAELITLGTSKVTVEVNSLPFLSVTV